MLNISHGVLGEESVWWIRRDGGATAAEWELMMKDHLGKLHAVFLDTGLVYQDKITLSAGIWSFGST